MVSKPSQIRVLINSEEQTASFHKVQEMAHSAGKRFRQALKTETPLQIVGTLNAYVAMMARQQGFNALYLSGAGVANASYGLPDLGMTSLENVLEDARRITAAVDTPLLVDIDTGWGSAFNIARTVREMIRAGVAAVHIEDQVAAKRCGHRPGKAIVSTEEMVDRIKAAVDARTDDDFVIMARTDAFANDGIDGAIARAQAFKDAGADMLFPEAMTDLAHYRALRNAVDMPMLANMTEFGKTELFTKEALAESGVDMILYPLSAARAMNQAALNTLKAIRQDGHQNAVVSTMQTREDLYHYLDYHTFERKLDQLFDDKRGGDKAP